MSFLQWPLCNALRQAAQKEKFGFHMPGHSAGLAFSGAFQSLLLSFDTTELPSTGDLNDPTGAVEESCRAAAEFCGARDTFYLTGGATCGIQAMLLAFVGVGGTLLVDPLAHRSVLHAAALFRIRVVLISRRASFVEADQVSAQTDFFDPLPHVTAAELAFALQSTPQAAAVLITSPNYYGNTADVQALAALCQTAQVPLLVDEAHGAHFVGAPDLFPQPALAAGCTACVQSTHKTLPALTQTALLHLSADSPVSGAHMMEVLRLLRTSSPSLMLAASIEYALADLAENGRSAYCCMLEAVRALPDNLRHPFRVSAPQPDGRRDPARVVIETSAVAPAPRISRALAKRGIEVEFADLTRLVLIPSPALTEAAWSELAVALNEIADRLASQETDLTRAALLDLDVAFRAAYGRAGRTTDPALLVAPFTRPSALRTAECPLEQASGKHLAVALTPYPPGIPLIWPGELLTPSLLRLVQALQEQQILCQGPKARDGRLWIRVVC